MKKIKILLVEDEPKVLQINKEYLTEKGYEVLCAETIRDARSILWESPPDLVLLDVMLPDGSGYDLCKEIRQMSSAPVIYLTCMGEDNSIVTGLNQGGDDYIVKPYNLNVLYARITALLRRQGYATGEIALPPLYMNLSAGTVKLDNQEIALTRKEFQILVYLVENRGKELSQEQIYEAVWCAPKDTMGNTIRVHISHLRQKLNLNETSSFDLSITANQNYLFLRTVYKA